MTLYKITEIQVFFVTQLKEVLKTQHKTEYLIWKEMALLTLLYACELCTLNSHKETRFENVETRDVKKLQDCTQNDWTLNGKKVTSCWTLKDKERNR